MTDPCAGILVQALLYDWVAATGVEGWFINWVMDSVWSINQSVTYPRCMLNGTGKCQLLNLGLSVVTPLPAIPNESLCAIT